MQLHQLFGERANTTEGQKWIPIIASIRLLDILADFVVTFATAAFATARHAN
jgi:hypothetical protein